MRQFYHPLHSSTLTRLRTFLTGNCCGQALVASAFCHRIPLLGKRFIDLCWSKGFYLRSLWWGVDDKAGLCHAATAVKTGCRDLCHDTLSATSGAGSGHREATTRPLLKPQAFRQLFGCTILSRNPTLQPCPGFLHWGYPNWGRVMRSPKILSTASRLLKKCFRSHVDGCSQKVRKFPTGGIQIPAE